MSERKVSIKVEHDNGLATVAWCVLMVLLAFLFDGKPDVWDALHAAAMRLLAP